MVELQGYHRLVVPTSLAYPSFVLHQFDFGALPPRDDGLRVRSFSRELLGSAVFAAICPFCGKNGATGFAGTFRQSFGLQLVVEGCRARF